MSVPALARILQRDTHRLISSKHSEGSEFVRVSNTAHYLRDMDDVERVTIDPLPSQIHPLQGAEVTSSGIAYRSVVNDTFGYPNVQGGRFNSSKRGAWYAGFELETSQAEVVWHLSRDLLEIGRLEDSVAYDDYLADFGGEFHDIREDANRGKYLGPHSYAESQALAESLVEQGSSGIIYPSVRHEGATASSASVPRSSAMFAKARATDLPGQDRSFPASRSKRREPQSSRLSCASNSAVATRGIPSSF